MSTDGSSVFATGTLASALGTLVAFLLRSLWTARIKRQEDIDKAKRANRIDFLGRQLSELYWPLYIRLEKDNAVWGTILKKQSGDDGTSAVAAEVERLFIRPNHRESVRIITAGFHLLGNASPTLIALLLAYVRHVAVYEALRKSGNTVDFPKAHGANYPNALFSELDTTTKQLQSQYDALIGTAVGART